MPDETGRTLQAAFSPVGAEPSVFKHCNVRESKSLDPASERGGTRRLFLE